MRPATNLKTLSGLAFYLMIAAGCANSSGSAAVASDADKDPERVICRDDINTGTRIPRKICKTAAEWETDAEETREINKNLERDTAPRSDLPTAGSGG